MPYRMRCLGSRETTPDPNQAPSAEAATIEMRVTGATGTRLMKTNADSTDSIVWPTLSVPGISSSGTRRIARKIAVVVANDPMPSVSKNTVTKPVASSVPDGRIRRRPLRWPGAATPPRTRR